MATRATLANERAAGSACQSTTVRAIRQCIFALGLVCITGCRDQQVESFTPANSLDTISQGEQIVQAIAFYQDRHGSIPLSLDSIVNDDLMSEVPIPPVGKKQWEYLVIPEQEGVFVLRACANNYYPCVSYSSVAKNWVVDQ